MNGSQIVHNKYAVWIKKYFYFFLLLIVDLNDLSCNCMFYI
ncbi:hypothetical protein LEAN103870_15260 [Legionella anisa]